MIVAVSPGFFKTFTLNTSLESGMFLVHVHENVLVHANACVAMCMGCSTPRI